MPFRATWQIHRENIVAHGTFSGFCLLALALIHGIYIVWRMAEHKF